MWNRAIADRLRRRADSSLGRLVVSQDTEVRPLYDRVLAIPAAWLLGSDE